MKPSPKPPSVPDRPEVAFHKGRAAELETRYNELLSDYNKLESEIAQRDALLLRVKNREGILLGFVAASAFFVVMAIYWRWNFEPHSIQENRTGTATAPYAR